MPTNYRQLFAIQANIAKMLKVLCPAIDTRSGIYFWTREDSEGKHAYIGKARNLLERNITHTQGKRQRIDGSIKKRGLYSEQNKLGWKLNVLHFPEDKLDEAERFYIELYRKAGIDLYNVESGGTYGKTDINERKPAKGYKDGLSQGYNNARKEVSHLFEKN